MLDLELYPVGITDLDAKLSARTRHSVINGVGLIVVAAGIDQNPTVRGQVNGVLDGQFAEHLLIAVDDLTGLEDFGCREHLGLQFHRLNIDLEAPVSDALLLEEILAHLLDPAHFLARVDSRSFERVPHTLRLADIFGDTVNKAELGRQVEVVLTNFDGEQRLLGTRHLHVVMEEEVLADGDFFFLEGKLHGGWVVFEVDIANCV